ncbi:family 1 encapsulin nanocompartment shell protein [Brevibacterium album]|uniref:family 1 encapsulin nanocompartment shell protein n=1 Tax=Brevibacterium album TaxID=417948 RepID=UPI000414CE88|nr:family 1 encapsulin nanocompartment shell protein [Brevibacterium album]
MTANNLHRELAPLSEAAWSDLEGEIAETFKKHIAGRRIFDMPEPRGFDFSALTTGRTAHTQTGVPEVRGLSRTSLPVVELRVPFSVSRSEADSVTRGNPNPDWDAAKEAAKLMAKAEDGAAFSGTREGIGFQGVIADSPHKPIQLPGDITELPSAVAEAITTLRLDGIGGPYHLVLSAELYTQLAEAADEGNPVSAHIQRILQDGDVVFAPAIEGAVVISARGGDYELHLGQDLSVGYDSHDATTVNLYLQETFTFRIAEDCAAIHLLP